MNGVGPLVKYPPMSYGQRAECDASSAAFAPQGTTSASSTCATTFFLVTVGGVKFHFNLFFELYVRTYVRTRSLSSLLSCAHLNAANYTRRHRCD